MTKQVDFYYDYGSPTSYLAWTQLPAICEVHGAGLSYRPVLLGGVFKETGNRSPVSVKPKSAWMFDDIARHAAYCGVPYVMNPHFTINTLTIIRGAIWAQSAGCLADYNKAMFEAVWVNQRNMAEAEQISDAVALSGLDGGAMAAAVQQPELKRELIAVTEAAVQRGVFGAPTMFVAGEMHFGQDRLDWVARALDWD
jgi:2-hydroxychromene-2-carboxylate isomerase